MDKQQNKYQRGRLISSSVAPKGQTERSAKGWSSGGSKFNKILNNLEKSFLSQFGNHHSGGSINKQQQQQSARQKLNQSDKTDDSVVAQLKEQSNNLAANKHGQQQVEKNAQIATKDCSNKTALQQKQRLQSESGKMTLNKYQLQIVSSLRPNQLISMSSRLSIPPPHANDEARNQNHQILFGETSLTDSSYDASTLKSTTATIRLNSNSKAADMTNKQNDIVHQADKVGLDAMRPSNSSPASSAKSLPTLVTKSGSQFNNRQATNDDEESGFSTYQSRRSLFNNTNNSSTANGSSSAPRKSNMIQMPSAQVPINSTNFNLTNTNSTNKNPSQQFVYSYQHPHMNHQQPPQQTDPISTQQQQLVTSSNQVPIIAVDASGEGCFTNSNNQLQHQLTNSPQRINNQSQFSDQQQLYGLYGPNGTIIPVTSADNGQPIYANAPPKPRRYQYYDSNQIIFPHMVQAFANEPQATAIATSSTLPVANSNGVTFIGYQHSSQFNRQGFSNQTQLSGQQQQQAKQQQFYPSQPIYNLSYLQVPNVYQSTDRPNPSINQRQQTNGPFTQQQRQVSLPQPLTKSKSNLDAGDLIRFKLDRSFDNHNHSSTLRIRQPQQQHQLIYGSRFDNPNHYPASIQAQQHQQASLVQGNLQRSKSVNHLLPNYERHQFNNQHQARDLRLDRMQAPGLKFLSVSSASTTNLNYAGLTSGAHTQQNQFAKVSSQLNISQQQQRQQYHDSILQQSNQLFSAAAIRQHHQQKLGNNWPDHHQPQLTPSCNDYNNQQFGASCVANKANSAHFSNTGKTIRQSQHQNDNLVLETGIATIKPSLDEKIRFLLIGKDNNEVSGSVSGILKGSNGNKLDSSSVIYHQSTSNNANNCIAQSGRIIRQQQHVSVQAVDPTSNSDLVLKRENVNQDATSSSSNSSKPLDADLLKTAAVQAATISQLNYPVDSELTNRIYINEASKMGNRNQRQYHVTGRQQSDSPTSRQQHQTQNQMRVDSRRRNDNANSQLIVDLTTPRVLATTQTTLLPASSRQQADTEKRDAWSINQVGLPQLSIATTTTTAAAATTTTTTTTTTMTTTITPITTTSARGQHKTVNSSDIASLHQASTCEMGISTASNQNFDATNSTSSNSCERTAPYYYSDLKSEEQRQALLSIVQQKSLSPPPQLLSRSADQSSTRLAPRSATSSMHSNQTRLLGESLAQRQIKTLKGLGKHTPANEFSSTSNIAENIDKLFDSPIQGSGQKISAVQSLLALSDCKEITDSSQLSSFQTNSISSGYHSGDMRLNKSFSKSKSLENISQRSSKETIASGNVANKSNPGNPVYENIRRADKLMSAINNSTTCLSTVHSNRRFSKISSNVGQQMESDESLDSILGSSGLDGSDSSLDVIDEIKISSSDNHLADISRLIEQLKINHSKLTEEYKSTLMRISKTINAKNRQLNDDNRRSEKVTERLRLLELKSKKCEARGKNQLALIQMMENVLKQSKLRAVSTGPQKDIHGLPPSSPASVNNSISSSSEHLKSNNDQLNSSPCSSFDYHNMVKHNSLQASSMLQNSSSPSSSGSQAASYKHVSLINGSHSSNEQATPNSSQSSSSRSAQSVIKAIVTEAKSSGAFVSEVKRASVEQEGSKSTGSSLSTRHPQNVQNSNNKSCGTRTSKKSGAVGQKILDIETKNRNNSFAGNKNAGEDSSSSCSTDSNVSSNELCKLSSKGDDEKKLKDQDKLDGSSDGGLHLYGDDEDFIEFLSIDGLSHRSQFEASQFSASDFNTSTSESSNSTTCNDSLNSPVISNSSAASSSTKETLGHGRNSTGILRNSKGGRNCIKAGGFENNNTRSNHLDKDEKANKFNNVLGNVIDVDVCPINNQCSPVNNRA